MRAIITGAASGIGRAVARVAAAEGGARLALADRDADGLERLAAELRGLGAQIEPVVADLADPADCEAVVAATAAAFGGLDAVVSNAGYAVTAPLRELSVEEFDRSMAINARPTWLLGRAAHGLLADSRGAIVATASMSARWPTPPLGAYSASKAALVMLVQQMALEWGPDGIRCNLVSPGPTLTGMTVGAFGAEPDAAQLAARRQREAGIPTRRLGEPEDVAAAILFLAGPAARQISGVDLLVDGGMSLSLMPATGSGTGHGAQG